MSKSLTLRLLDNPMRAETSEWPRCAREAVATRRLFGLMVVSMPGLNWFSCHLKKTLIFTQRMGFPSHSDLDAKGGC